MLSKFNFFTLSKGGTLESILGTKKDNKNIHNANIFKLLFKTKIPLFNKRGISLIYVFK